MPTPNLSWFASLAKPRANAYNSGGVSWFMSLPEPQVPAPAPPPVNPPHILLETGEDILIETGGVILLE